MSILEEEYLKWTEHKKEHPVSYMDDISFDKWLAYRNIWYTKASKGSPTHRMAINK